LQLLRLEAREVPSGNRIFAISEDAGGSRVAVYEAFGPGPQPDSNGSGGGQNGPTFDGRGKLLTSIEPFTGFAGGVRITTDDVTGDGIDDLVVAAGKGGGPHVRVYDGANLLQGQARICGEFFAFDARFTGGVFVAVGQMDPQSPQLEIVVGAGEGGGPHVKVFEMQQVIFTVIGGATPPSPYFFANEQNGFFAFDASFRGGVRVAAADTTGDGKAELIAAAGPGGGPHVRVFDVNPPNPAAIYPYGFKAIDEFFAFDPRFRGGVYVAAGELNGIADKAEVVVGAGEGGGPHVKVYAVNSNNRLAQVAETFVSGPDDRGGVRVGIGNLSNLTGRQSIYIGRGPQQVVTLAIPFADHRLAGFTLDNNQLNPMTLYVPDILQSHFRTGLFVGV
jgi:hypothetical protein